MHHKGLFALHVLEKEVVLVEQNAERGLRADAIHDGQEGLLALRDGLAGIKLLEDRAQELVDGHDVSEDDFGASEVAQRAGVTRHHAARQTLDLEEAGGKGVVALRQVVVGREDKDLVAPRIALGDGGKRQRGPRVGLPNDARQHRARKEAVRVKGETRGNHEAVNAAERHEPPVVNGGGDPCPASQSAVLTVPSDGLGRGGVVPEPGT